MPQWGGGRLYQRKDFSADAVRTLYRNFETGMIDEYLAARPARDAALRLIELERVGMTPLAARSSSTTTSATSSARRFPASRHCRVSAFAAQLDWLQARFDVIDGPTFERAVRRGAGSIRPTALLTFDDGFVDHYEHVFPVLRDAGLGGIFFLVGATLGDRPRLLNVHRTHFLLSQLGAARFAGRWALRLSAEGVSSHAASGGREGIYRYDEAPDVRVKRILNYEAPYPVADRVLSELFARHLGDSDEFARSSVSVAAQIREMARGRHDVRLPHRVSPGAVAARRREQQRAELRRRGSSAS